jgi:preprotein translocase subunit SecA
MFGMMMKGIAQDLVKYVMHVQVQVNEPAPAVAEESKVQNLQYSSPDEGTGSGMASAARSVAAEAGAAAPAAAGAVATAEPATMTPIVKSEWDKTPRNAPCPCGSGKKFKLCHGKA